MGISEDELEQASEQMGMFMENMDDFDFGDIGAMFNSENADGAQTMPFSEMMNNIMGGSESSTEEPKKKVKEIIKGHRTSRESF